MQLDVFKHLSGTEELRITADDSFIFRAIIWIEYKITEQSNNTIFCESTLYHSKQRADTVCDRIGIICFIPSVIIFIRSKNTAHPGIRTVTYHRQKAVFHQLRYITAIADRDLFPSIVNCCIFLYCCLEFKDSHRNTVDKQQHIRTAQMFTLYRILIYDLEDIFVRLIIVDIVNMECDF